MTILPGGSHTRGNPDSGPGFARLIFAPEQSVVAWLTEAAVAVGLGALLVALMVWS